MLGPDDDLQAAIDGAAAGAVLHLAPGTYALAAPLRLYRGVRLVGAGAAETRLLRPRQPHAPLAEARVPAGETLTLEGLTLGWDDDPAERPGVYLFESDGLVVAGGRVALLSCRLLGSAAEHRRSGDDMYGGAGLRANGDADVRAEGCEIAGHGGHGVLAGERAAVALANGWLAGNRGLGLLAQGSATVDLRATAIAENTRGGASACDAAGLSLAGVTVQDNRRFGLRLGASRPAAVTGCTIEANGGPGVAVDAPAVAISGGAIARNAGDGVAIAERRHVTLASLVVEANRGYGLALAPGADVTLARVAFIGNGRGDIERR